MKVLLINGSPHSAGSTYTALHAMEEVFEKEGIETELIQIGHLNIRGCTACGFCKRHKKCVYDDIVNKIAAKLEEADGMVVGTPVYYASCNSTTTAMMDRLFYSLGFDTTMKVGASVVSARRGGLSASMDQLNKYFSISGMPIASSTYWNDIHGNDAMQASQDLEGLRTMRNLAHNMSFLVKSINLGKEQFGLPEKEPRVSTNFIR